MRYTITLLESHLHELRSLLIRNDGLERPAILLCGRSLIRNDIWDGGPEERLLSREIIPIDDREIISNTNVNVYWETQTFRKALQIAEQKNLAICIIHNHPDACLEYSSIDDASEPELFKAAFNRNVDDRIHGSLVLTPSGEIFGRVWTKNLKSYPFSLIRVLGNRFQFFYPGKYNSGDREIFHRQQLAFGKALNNDLSKLRIGIIGCGATGSATAHLLARLGVGQILLIDNDLVERTNLNRLYGPTVADADAGKSKVEVLRDYLSGIGIGARVRIIKGWVGESKVADVLKSCDIVFGCTDDDSGRIFLNRFSHFYLIPVIDMGVEIIPTVEQVGVQSLQGRMTMVFPGNVCLLCRNIVDPIRASEENLMRTDPAGFERQKDEAYVKGGKNPSPAVITFTTEAASMSVNELINRIVGYKKNGHQNMIMRFFDRGVDGKPGARSSEGCPICAEKHYWGKGDMDPFMDQAN